MIAKLIAIAALLLAWASARHEGGHRIPVAWFAFCALLALLSGCSTLGAVGMAMLTDPSVSAAHQPQFACGSWWGTQTRNQAQTVANLGAVCRRISF